jgi:hypothetical protein
MSLAIVKRHVTRRHLVEWSAELRRVAEQLERASFAGDSSREDDAGDG